MGRFTKRVIAGLTAALVLAGGASAQFLVDDLNHGSNEHRLGNYWYYYVSDDGGALEAATAAQHNAIITTAQPGDAFGSMTFKAMEAMGRNGTGGAVLRYSGWGTATLGDYTTSHYPLVGMGMLLTDHDTIGYGPEFANVSSITFWARSGAEPQVFIFKVETTENAPVGEFERFVRANSRPDSSNAAPNTPRWNMANAYATKFNATETWTQYTVNLGNIVPPTVARGSFIGTGVASGSVGGGNNGQAASLTTTSGLAQFPWWGYSFTFNPNNATKIAWQVQHEDNETSLSGGELRVDDIQFHGSFTYTPHNVCNTCVGQARPQGSVKFSDFEGSDPLMNALGFYWYAYNDSIAGGQSEILNVVPNPHVTGQWIMDVEGAGNPGNAANIEFITYGMFNDRNNPGSQIQSFVGIGTNLYNSEDPRTEWTFLNATQAQHTGIAFDFRVSGSAVQFISVEFQDKSDVLNAEDNFDDGQVFHTRIPVTGRHGQWTSAVVHRDNLVLPKWVMTNNTLRRHGTTLNWNELGKIQFKIEGQAAGTLAIDNVYWVTTGVNVRHTAAARATGLRATYNRGVVGVNWDAASTIRDGKISLINTRGRVISSTPITNVSGNRITANLGSNTIPTGMYFVRIDARDVNGKRIVQQAPISIVK